MYSDLLQAVLTGDIDAPAPSRSHSSPSELVRLRHAMEKHAARNDPGWALQTVADQLAYDAALVRIAWRRGVVVDIESFDVPEQGRASLEQSLTAKGVTVPLSSVPSGPSPGDDH